MASKAGGRGSRKVNRNRDSDKAKRYRAGRRAANKGTRAARRAKALAARKAKRMTWPVCPYCNRHINPARLAAHKARPHGRFEAAV